MARKDIKNITIIGAGAMGHQIAMLCALGGYETTLHDMHEDVLSKAKESLQYQMDKWVTKGKISRQTLDTAFNRISVTTSLVEASSDADFVIEAVVERLDVKRDLFEKLDRLTPPHAILTTNSSTIVNSKLAEVTSRPGKVCNMHFFFPPLVMDCVEVVMNEQTTEETGEIVMDVCKHIHRTAILLRKEIWGFVANRLLFALHSEAIKLYEEGICGFKDIDIITKKALKHPLGPFELMDLSGIDVGYFAQLERYEETGNPKDMPAKSIEEKVKAGNLGRKTGKGWYDY